MSESLSALTGQSKDHLLPIADGLWIHAAVKADFERMQAAANADGLDLTIASGFRDFERQLLIWNNKFLGIRPVLDQDGEPLDITRLSDDEKVRAILRWSALPGASRHHWGTDMDVYAKNLLPAGESLQLAPWEYDSGHQKPLSDWLQAHMAEFGFYRPYREDKGGVAIEPWHISHRDTAQRFLKQLTPETLRSAIAASEIAGRDAVLAQLDWIYCQYVINICEA